MAYLLSIVTFLPAVGAVLVLLLPRREEGLTKQATLAITIATFVVSLPLFFRFDRGSADYQFVEIKSWIPSLGVSYHVGVDGISVLLVLLTTFLMPLVILSSWHSVESRWKEFAITMLLLETGMLGVFVALDLFLFYVFWEAMLIPMYLIIGIWGGPNRVYAAVKFILYTLAGSLLMLVAILFVYFQHGSATNAYTFDLPVLVRFVIPAGRTQDLLFFAFALAFAIKVPMFPFHTWLPHAHVEAPTAGSVILASIMLKMGTYGFLRFALPFFPGVAMSPTVRTTILALAVVGILYGALVAMVQPDFKKLVAYSSVSHLGFVMLGIFALTLQSVQGAIMVMINHGISTGALFLLVGILYERRHTRMIAAYGGIARVVPMFAALLTLVSLSSIGLPGTNGFIGEFLVLLGSFRTQPYMTFLSTFGVILAAAYLLWAIQRILFNPLDKPENEHISDLNRRELGMMGALVAAILWIGLYPAPILRRTEPAASRLVSAVSGAAPTRVARAGSAETAGR